MSETRKRAKYTLEFKMEAFRLVKGGQAISVTAKVLGIPKASLDNWVKLSAMRHDQSQLVPGSLTQYFCFGIGAVLRMDRLQEFNAVSATPARHRQDEFQHAASGQGEPFRPNPAMHLVRSNIRLLDLLWIA